MLNEATTFTGAARSSRERKQTTFFGVTGGNGVSGNGGPDERGGALYRSRSGRSDGSGAAATSSAAGSASSAAIDGGLGGRYPKRERREVEFLNPSAYDAQHSAADRPRYGQSSRFDSSGGRDRDRGRGGGGGGDRDDRQHRDRDRGGRGRERDRDGAGGGGRRHFDSSSESDRSSRDSDSMRGGPLDSASDSGAGSGDEGGAATMGRAGGGAAGAGGSSSRGKRGARLDPSVIAGFANSVRGAGGGGKRGRGGSLFGTGGGAGGGDVDEADFDAAQERRRAADLAAIQPYNVTSHDANGGGGGKGDPSFKYTKRDVARADASPLGADSSLSFSSVGGLEEHLRGLKEMVTLPLLYPEVFSRFGLKPPRGVLFHGPPGTGKTLVARALASQCSTDGRRISFFMVKGAQLLSKWLGESERQLRLIFEQARTLAPSIVFFDEFDAIAPVRSSKQDQIHSSIVGTLLALLDGLDDRGQVIVIGATNRPDAIDPALRRPGRFDRELYFPLPSATARRSILGIHTRAWSPPLAPSFLSALARATSGYCGADLAALCSEAALRSVRRRFPQIYESEAKLRIDPGDLRVGLADFAAAMRDIVPAAARSARDGHARGVPPHLMPLVAPQLASALTLLRSAFPFLKGAAVALLADACASALGSSSMPPGAALGSEGSLLATAPAPSAAARGAGGATASAITAMLEESGLVDYDSDNSDAVAAVYGQLNRDECDTCGQEGSLVCCDACPAAFCVPGAEGAGRGPKARRNNNRGGKARRAGGLPGGGDDVDDGQAGSAAPAGDEPGASSVSAGAGGHDAAAAGDAAAAFSDFAEAASAAAAPLFHPDTCIPALGPLPDLESDDAPWQCAACSAKAAAGRAKQAGAGASSSSSSSLRIGKPAGPGIGASLLNVDAVLTSAGKRPCYRPRLTLVAPSGASPGDHGAHVDEEEGSGAHSDGVAEMLARALLHACEEVPALSLDMTSLASDPGSRAPVEALASRVAEARRSAPSILYLPCADAWWALADDGLRGALVSLLDGIPADLPVLLISTLAQPPPTAAAAAQSSAAASGGPKLALPAWALTSGISSSLAQPAKPSSALAALASSLPRGLSRLLFGPPQPPLSAVLRLPSLLPHASGGLVAVSASASALPTFASPFASSPMASPSSSSSSAPAPTGAASSPADADIELSSAGVLRVRPFSPAERRAFFAPLWAALLPVPSHLRGVASGEEGAGASGMLVDGSELGSPSPALSGTSGDDGLEEGDALARAQEVARRRTERREAKRARNAQALEPAPPPPPPAPPSAAELAAMRRERRAKEDKVLKSLRIGLRSVLDDLAREPKYRTFSVPVDVGDAPDYYAIVGVPMDFQTMNDKVSGARHSSNGSLC